MFLRDGTLCRQGAVVLLDKRDITIIERAELRRVFIVGNELRWLTANGIEHAHEFQWDSVDSRDRICVAVAEIFDSIVFETGEAIWHRAAGQGGRWTKTEANRDELLSNIEQLIKDQNDAR
jgi:hypothetical protein